MIYHYCVENNCGSLTSSVLKVYQEITEENVERFIDDIYKDLKETYGDKYTKENSVIISLTKL